MSEAAGALVRCETDKIAWTYHLCRFVLIHLRLRLVVLLVLQRAWPALAEAPYLQKASYLQ